MNVHDLKIRVIVAIERQKAKLRLGKLLLSIPRKRRRGNPPKKFHVANTEDIEEGAPPTIGHGYPN